MPTLKNLVDEVVNIENAIVSNRDALKQILINKNIQGITSETKLSNLINKVGELRDYKKQLYLYKTGDEYTSLTGGYKAYWVYTSGTLSNTSNGIIMKTPSLGGNNGKFITAKSINFSGYSTLFFEVTSVSTSYTFSVEVFDGTSINAETIANVSELNGKGIYAISVSHIGSGYVGLHLSSHTSVTVKNIWLEE